MKELKIIYKNNKPYGIRDYSGFLFFFAKIPKFSGQEERYRLEIEEQFKLADYLLLSLKLRIGSNVVRNIGLLLEPL